MPAAIDGGKWTFNSDIGGYKMRSVMATKNDNSTATAECAGADGKWVPTSTIKATRAKSRDARLTMRDWRLAIGA